MSPLTPGEAIAIAAILEVHPRRLPHWDRWVEALRTWGNAGLAAGETPSQDTNHEPGRAKMRGTTKAAPASALTLKRGPDHTTVKES